MTIEQPLANDTRVACHNVRQFKKYQLTTHPFFPPNCASIFGSKHWLSCCIACTKIIKKKYVLYIRRQTETKRRMNEDNIAHVAAATHYFTTTCHRHQNTSRLQLPLFLH